VRSSSTGLADHALNQFFMELDDRRMQITIEVRGKADGEYRATCPQIGICCQGQSLEEVLERIKDLLVFYVSTVDESDMSAEEQAESRRRLSLYLKGKNLYLPPDPKIH
jgi:predicted RNase H-like HicB family nuclease